MHINPGTQCAIASQDETLLRSLGHCVLIVDGVVGVGWGCVGMHPHVVGHPSIWECLSNLWGTPVYGRLFVNNPSTWGTPVYVGMHPHVVGYPSIWETPQHPVRELNSQRSGYSFCLYNPFYSYIYTCIDIYIYTYIHVYVYIHAHTHIHIHIHI